MNDDLSPQPADLTSMREIESRLRARTQAMQTDLARLRSQVRILGLGFGLSLSVLALLIFAPSVFGPPALGDIVEARSFRIVDGSGITRGEWAVDDEGNARMSLLDQRSRPRLNMTVLGSGFPGVALINGEGQRRAVLGLLPDETTTLVFADGSGVPRAVLGLTRADEANLAFADAEGVTRLGMGLAGNGMGSVMMPQDTVSTAPAAANGGGGGGR